MKKEKSCGAVIYKFEENEVYVLLLKHNLGHWSFAKGHVEAGETEVETAKREVKEEVGLDIETMLRSISNGAAGSWQMTNNAPKMNKRDFEPGFYIKHIVKDLKIANL